MKPSGTVFLVEDDDDIRTSAVWTLQNAGVAVEAHSSAEELLNALKPDMPGCYVLDLQLPEMSGMDLRRRLVEMGCRQPFLILSRNDNGDTGIEHAKAVRVSEGWSRRAVAHGRAACDGPFPAV